MLNVADLVKTYGTARGRSTEAVRAVDGISIAVEPGQLFTLLGPSGCGKTTTLRCIAGLEVPDSGEIRVGDRVMFSSRSGTHVPANDRNLGMVFQSYAIWPHMTVHENVAFPLEVGGRGARRRRGETAARVDRVLSVVQLEDLAGRRATELSGGQQQRLALARALVMEPPMLLLDEPLSNLDAKLREEMRFELKRLQREIGITTIYVTHDQTEALAMSNQIAVLHAGRIEQLGGPREIYERPASRFVAGFIGTTNFIEGRVERIEGSGAARRVVIATSLGEVQAESTVAVAVGAQVAVAVRPEHVLLRPAEGDEVSSPWRGTVHTRAFLGEAVDHLVRVGGHEVKARCPTGVSYPAGTDVIVEFPSPHCSVLPVDH